jgi:hypothetical protein
MSAQLPPNPILTTYQYWNWVNVDEATRRQRALDNNYMTFPTAQNYPTFFSKLFLVTDATLTKMANTSYVYSAFLALLSAINIWTGLNTFGSIDTGSITTNTITATTLALSGTRLDTPVTSNMTYIASILTLGGGNVTTTSGTPVGTIGHVIHRNMADAYLGPNTTAGPITLTTGVWFIVGQYSSFLAGGLNGDKLGIGIKPSNVNLIGQFAMKNFVSGAQLESIRANGQETYMSTSSYVVVTGATQTYYLNMSEYGGSGIGTNRMYLRAVRVA